MENSKVIGKLKMALEICKEIHRETQWDLQDEIDGLWNLIESLKLQMGYHDQDDEN
jgi:argininosuccinate lyase